jgi:hypothetical protein
MQKKPVVSTVLYFSVLAVVLLSGYACSIEKISSTPIYFETKKGQYDIPKGYETYTLFIATSYAYVDNLSGRDMRQLKKQIERFGGSIGGKNLAVWVREPNEDRLNVELGKTYADRLNLDYSGGPYLIFLTYHPDTVPDRNDFAAVIGFSNKTPKYTIEAIEYLEAEIRRGHVSKFDVRIVNFWLDLKSFAAEHKGVLEAIVVSVITDALRQHIRRSK